MNKENQLILDNLFWSQVMKKVLSTIVIATCVISVLVFSNEVVQADQTASQRPVDNPKYKKAKKGPWCGTYELWKSGIINGCPNKGRVRF